MTKKQRMWLALFIFNLGMVEIANEPLLGIFNLLCAAMSGLFFVFTEK